MPKDVIEIQDSQEPLPVHPDNADTMEVPESVHAEKHEELLKKFNSEIPTSGADATAATKAS